jgi:shikimate dehydrogenase
VNRTVDKAEEILVSLPATGLKTEAAPYASLDKAMDNADLLINTTPIGMHPNEAEIPLDAGLLKEGLVVSDLVYRPRMTRLLQEAKKRGCVIHGGLGMLIYQGAIAFERWTGMKAPVDVMRKAVE